MSRWKKVSAGIVIFLLLLIVAVGALLTTTSGLHLLLRAADRWTPGLDIGRVSGGWRDLTLNEVHFAQPGVTVSVGQLHLAVKLRCLWDRRLCVDDLSLRDLAIVIDTHNMPPAKPVTNKEKPLNLALPYPLELKHIALQNMHIAVDDTAIAIQNFSTAIHWQEKNLTLMPSWLQGMTIVLPETKKAADNPSVTSVSARPPSPAEPISALFSQPLLAKINDGHLPLNLTIEAFHGERLRLNGNFPITIGNLLLKVRSREDEITLDTLNIDSDQGKLRASGDMQLHGAWPVKLTLNSILNIGALENERATLNLNGELRNKMQFGMALAGPLAAKLDGEIVLAEAGLPLNIALNSPHLYWPLSGEKQIEADNLQLNISGKITDYTIAFSSAICGASLPPAGVALHANGNQQQLNLDKLTITALQGKTELQGLLDWQQALSWQGELTFNGINTTKMIPDGPVKLNGQLKSHGSLYGGSWQVAVPELKMSGNIRGNNLDVSGSLQGNSYMQWTTPGLSLVVGKNRLAVKGELGEKNLNLDAVIDAPRLDQTWTGLSGTVKGELKARGTVDAPQWLADLSANSLRWQELTIAHISIAGEVQPSAPVTGNLNLRLDRLNQPGMTIKQLQLAMKGNEKQHHLTLKAEGDPLSGQLALTGAFDRQSASWQGTLSDTRLQTPVGPVALVHNVALDYRYAAQEMRIGPHCWRHPQAELCAPQTIEAGRSGHVVARLNYLNLAMLAPFLPPETHASGVLSGHTDIRWDTTQSSLPQGKVTLSGRDVKISQTINEIALPFAFDTLNVTALLQNNRAQLEWLMRLTNHSQLDGQIQINDPQGRRHLAGHINIDHIALAMIKPLLARGEAQGELNAHLRLAGSVRSPQLYGQMLLSDADIDANFMPFDMQPSQLAINFNGARSTLQGTVNTRQGDIALSGDADWTQIDNWRAQIAASGHQVRITVPPMARLDISPDIRVTATPNLLTLDGRVDIPWARIVVDQVPESAVAISGDEVMLDKNLKPIHPQHSSMPINSNLMIHIGNDARLSAFGLKARLTGDLQVSQDKQGLGLNGQITIPQGRFHAYGQDLLVRKGELLFSGSPEQPMLNIEAIRNPDVTEDGVIAGVRVTGTADQPKAEIFSDPAMSQQQALSYLLRGQGLGSEQNDSAAMTSILVGLGVAQSGQIMGKIGETFGISNLVLDTEGAGDTSQVVVSGYVLPGLQVKYGVGIFDSLATLTLRYRLMPQLYLEAISGVDQALDLLYQFEF